MTTAARISVANNAVSSTVAGTSLTRTSTVGYETEGRTSQYTIAVSRMLPLANIIRTISS